MSDSELMLQQVDGVQFFVANDGTVGLSQRGLAKLAGISPSSAKRDIDSILNANPLCTNSENVAERYTVKGVEGDHSWTKIYDADTCILVIQTKAFKGNTIAQQSYTKFAKIGFTKWVQDVTGYAAADNTTLLAQTLQQVLTSVNILQATVDEMKEDTKKFRAIVKRSSEDLPGLNILITSISAESDLLGSSDTFSLAEWLKSTKGVVLDQGGAIAMGNLTAALYKGHRQVNPCKETRYAKADVATNTKRMSGVRTVYNPNDFPFLEMAWQKYMASKI